MTGIVEKLEAFTRLAEMLAKSSLVPLKDGKDRMTKEDILFVVLAGDELGLEPLKALRGLTVARGKVSLAAETLVALVRRHRDVCEYLRLVESTPEQATWEAKRVGDAQPTRITFTMADAKKAGIAGSAMYAKYPSQMLRWRGASAICKAVFSDLALGLYDSNSGELSDGKVEREPEPEAFVEPVAPVEREPGSDDGDEPPIVPDGSSGQNAMDMAGDIFKAQDRTVAKVKAGLEKAGMSAKEPSNKEKALLYIEETQTQEAFAGLAKRLEPLNMRKDEDVLSAYRSKRKELGL